MPIWIFSALGYVKDNWKLVSLVIIGLIIFAYVEMLRIDVLQKENQIIKLEHENATLKHNAESLEAALKTQNDTIGKIDALAKQTQQSFARLGVDVANQGTNLNTPLANILKDKRPVTCEDTIRYLIEAQKGYAK